MPLFQKKACRPENSNDHCLWATKFRHSVERIDIPGMRTLICVWHAEMTTHPLSPRPYYFFDSFLLWHFLNLWFNNNYHSIIHQHLNLNDYLYFAVGIYFTSSRVKVDYVWNRRRLKIEKHVRKRNSKNPNCSFYLFDAMWF